MVLLMFRMNICNVLIYHGNHMSAFTQTRIVYDWFSKWFVTLVKKEDKNIISTHCFMSREALVAKTMGKELAVVLNEIIKTVNFIKSRPLK